MWVESKWRVTYSLADSDGFTRETFRVWDALLHDGLKQLLLVNTIKWRLEGKDMEKGKNKVRHREAPVNKLKANIFKLKFLWKSVEVITNESTPGLSVWAHRSIVGINGVLPVLPAFHRAVLHRTTSLLLYRRADTPQSEKDRKRKRGDKK